MLRLMCPDTSRRRGRAPGEAHPAPEGVVSRQAKEGTVEFENARALRSNHAETALEVKLEDRDKPVWFPQYAIDEDSEVYKAGHEGRLVVSERIAVEKGLV